MFVGCVLDLITQLPETDDKECYLIVVIDCHSKWVEMGPLENKEFCTIANWFYPN